MCLMEKLVWMYKISTFWTDLSIAWIEWGFEDVKFISSDENSKFFQSSSIMADTYPALTSAKNITWWKIILTN